MTDSQAYLSAVERAKQINSKLSDNSSFSASSQAGMKRSAPGYDNTYQATEKRAYLNDKNPSAAAAEAVARLNQKLGYQQQQQQQSMSQNYPTNQYSNGSSNMPSATQTVSITIQIPDRLVGLIIGKRGEQITALQAESNCKVQISQEQTGVERPITLTGNSQQIEHARRLINDLINRADRGGPPNPGMPHPGQAGGDSYTQIEILVPGNKAGLVIGKGGETIKSLQEEHGVKMVLIQQTNQASAEDKPLRISGDVTRVERVKQVVMELINGKAGAGGGMPPMGNRFEGHGQDFQRFAVPAEKAGLVIGKGGENIKVICKMTDCHVEISKEPPPSPSLKLFNIRGSAQDIEKAKKLISERAGMPYNSSDAFGASTGYNVYAYMQDPSQSDNGGMPGPSINPYTGMPDYSAAWIEYYRRLGMPEQAEKIMLQAQQQGMGGQGAQQTAASGAPSTASYPQQQQMAQAQPSQTNAAPSGQSNMDYSQWQVWQQWQAWQSQQQAQTGQPQPPQGQTPQQWPMAQAGTAQNK